MYFPDMTPYRYLGPESGTLNVGWLDAGKEFSTGLCPPGFAAALARVPLSVHTRGWHDCPFCGKAQGSAEKRVKIDGKEFAAPQLIDHYVAAHDYLPPGEFIAAVMAVYG